MPKLVLPKDIARAIVENGTALATKSTQKVRRAADLQEDAIALFKLTTAWARDENGEYCATGYMILPDETPTSGLMKIYAPTAPPASESETEDESGEESDEHNESHATEAGFATGSIIHAAHSNGRWELLGGSGGADVVLPLWKDEQSRIRAGTLFRNDNGTPIREGYGEAEGEGTTVPPVESGDFSYPAGFFINSCHVVAGEGIEFYDAGDCAHSFDPIIVGIKAKKTKGDVQKEPFVKSFQTHTGTIQVLTSLESASAVASVEPTKEQAVTDVTAENADFVKTIEAPTKKAITKLNEEQIDVVIGLEPEYKSAITKVTTRDEDFVIKVETTPANCITKIKPKEATLTIKPTKKKPTPSTQGASFLKDVKTGDANVVGSVEPIEFVDAITEIDAPTTNVVESIQLEDKTVNIEASLVETSAAEGGFQVITAVWCENNEIKVQYAYLGIHIQPVVFQGVDKVVNGTAVKSATPKMRDRAIKTLRPFPATVIGSVEGVPGEKEALTDVEFDEEVVVDLTAPEELTVVTGFEEPDVVEVVKTLKAPQGKVIVEVKSETGDKQFLTGVEPQTEKAIGSVEPDEEEFVQEVKPQNEKGVTGVTLSKREFVQDVTASKENFVKSGTPQEQSVVTGITPTMADAVTDILFT